MDNSVISLIISVIALLVSVTTGVYQIYRAHKEAKLQNEVIRSSLLTELLHAVYSHQEHRSNIKRLLNEAATNQRLELVPALEKIDEQNSKNEEAFLGAYNDLLSNKSPQPEYLEQIRHIVESMNFQSKELARAINKYHIKRKNE